MEEQLLELLPDIAGLVVETVLVGVLATVGVLSEGRGIAAVTGGETLGLWYVFMGAVALYAGYLLFSRRVLPDLREALGGSDAGP